MPFDEEELDPHGECRHEIQRLRSALEELTAATEKDCCSPETASDGDDEPVGITVTPDGVETGTAVTFGMIRRARAALSN